MLSDKELIRPGLMEIPFPEPAGAGRFVQEKLVNWEGLDSLRLSRSRSSSGCGIWWICLLKAAAEVRCGFLWAGMGGFSQAQAAEPSACLRSFGPSRRGWNDGKVTVASGNVLPLGKEGWMCACAGRKRGESNSRNCNNSRLSSLLRVFVLKQRRAHA